MPRIPPRIINHAARIDSRLVRLLPECRDLNSTGNELRWMKEDVLNKTRTSELPLSGQTRWNVSRRLDYYVGRRARGEPLQYILGTQPFGDLEIKCVPGVLIPRSETETYTTELSRTLQNVPRTKEERDLRVADFCSGSGCISLLLHSLLQRAAPDRDDAASTTWNIQVRGFDISPKALELAKENLEHNIKLGLLQPSARQHVTFSYLDVLSLARQSPAQITNDLVNLLPTSEQEGPEAPNDQSNTRPFDIIISNPPYISPADFKPGSQTSKSVRKFEPELALVPPAELCFPDVDRADQFYTALLRIAGASEWPNLLVIEVGGTNQAERVREICRINVPESTVIEIWRDDGSVVAEGGAVVSSVEVFNGVEQKVECRAIVLWFNKDWIEWRKKDLANLRRL